MPERCEKVVPQQGSILDRACGKPVAEGSIYCKRHRPNAAKLATVERHRKSTIHEAERRVIEAAKEWQRWAVSWTGVEVALSAAVRALQDAERD